MVRIYFLARELGVESKDLLDLCRQAGFDVKNQLSSLDPEQRDEVERLVKRGGGVATAAPPPPPKPTVLPSVSSKVRTLPTSRPVPREPETRTAPPAPPHATPPPV